MSAIRVRKVSKSYRFARQRPFLLRELLRYALFQPASYEEHLALRDLSFEIDHGESVAIVGANGSGKSTLLSLIAQTSYPSKGDIEIRGRVGSLLELGAGFHYQLTGRENIYLNASLMGLGRNEIDDKREAIIDYADIGHHIDASISTYSTGMLARLGFAILAHLEPEILIVDEALSVGDVHFTKKCETTMQAMLEKGTTMLLVSHNMATVSQLCSRTLWLDEGRLRAQGPTEEVLAEYLQSGS